MSEVLSNSAGRALGSIISKTRNLKVCGYSTYTKLFNTGVLPILLYCSGVWGAKSYKTENIRYRASRYFLGLNKYAPLHAVHGDMGWRSISVELRLNVLRLWNKLIRMKDDRIPKKIFSWEYDLGINSWCSEVEQIFSDINCHDVFMNKRECSIDDCCTKLELDYEEEWNRGRQVKSKLHLYNIFKLDCKVDKYVLNCNKMMRSHIAQFRSGILPLNVETGRHNKVERKDRICKFCSMQETEDEIHFLCKCPLYVDCRKVLFDIVKTINL